MLAQTVRSKGLFRELGLAASDDKKATTPIGIGTHLVTALPAQDTQAEREIISCLAESGDRRDHCSLPLLADGRSWQK